MSGMHALVWTELATDHSNTPDLHSRCDALVDDLGSEAFHLFELRTALQEKQIDAYLFEFIDSLGDLMGRPD